MDGSSGTSGATQLTPQNSDEGSTVLSSRYTRSSGPRMVLTPQGTSSDLLLSSLASQGHSHADGSSDIMHPGEGPKTSQSKVPGTSIGVEGHLDFRNQPTNGVGTGE